MTRHFIFAGLKNCNNYFINGCGIEYLLVSSCDQKTGDGYGYGFITNGGTVVGKGFGSGYSYGNASGDGRGDGVFPSDLFKLVKYLIFDKAND
jgi:hypothetical protein